MISNQVLQSTIDGLGTIARIEICVVNIDGRVIASTNNSMDDYAEQAMEFAKSSADSQEMSGCQFFKIFEDGQLEYVLVSEGSGEDVYTMGKMVAFQIQSLVVAYKERFDKDNFIKNLLLDNFLLVDIFSRAKKLHIQTDVRRVALIIEAENGKDNNILELMRVHYGSNNKDFITVVDENSVIVVKELGETDGEKEIKTVCENYTATLSEEGITGIRISFGTIVKELKEVSRSYKEAKMARDVGKIFFDERNIVAYTELGIGRLIYQLPLPQCKIFIKEVFGENDPNDFDSEVLRTINLLLDANQNMSEASRLLNTHRNTLVYRLNKFQKTTGLDLRQFEDAIICKIALMVIKYMNYVESQQY